MVSDCECDFGAVAALSTAENAGFKCGRAAFFRVFERPARTLRAITLALVDETTWSKHMC